MPSPPITNLPPELLASIFFHIYRPDGSNISAPPSAKELDEYFSEHPLLNLMLVCHDWYDIIQNAPALWTLIVAGTGVPANWSDETLDSVKSDGRAKWLEECFKRSGELLVDVALITERFLDLMPIIEVLQKYAHRIRTLSLVPWDRLIFSWKYTPPVPVSEMLKGPFPALRKLFFGPPSESPGMKSILSVSRVELDAPALTDLACAFHLILPTQAPQSRITELSLYRVYLNSIVPPLEQANIPLPQLLKLRIKDCNVAQILEALSVPSLQTLVVQMNMLPDQAISKPINYPVLQEIQWEDHNLDLAFECVLRASPSLTRLANYAIGDEPDLGRRTHPVTSRPFILDAMTAASSQSGAFGRDMLWPHLGELLLAMATYEVIARILEVARGVKVVRLLYDATERSEGNDIVQDMALLDHLKQRVEIVMAQES